MSDEVTQSEVDKEEVLLDYVLQPDGETVEVYEAWGCIKHEVVSTRARRQYKDYTWPDAELAEGIGHISIVPFKSIPDHAVRLELHGDDPDDAFLYVGGMDEVKVKEMYLKTRTAARGLIREVWG